MLLTGVVTIYNTNAGTINLNAANSVTLQIQLSNTIALGNAPVTMTAGTLVNNTGSANLALANPITFNTRVVTLAATNRILFAGPITVSGANQFRISTQAQFGGVVSGTGSVKVLGGNALVMLNPNSTYSGGTNLGAGNLQVNASSSASVGPITKCRSGSGRSI